MCGGLDTRLPTRPGRRVVFSKSLVVGRSQSLAAFGAAALQYQLPCLGFHPHAKPMGLSAAPVVWLVRPFHPRSPLITASLRKTISLLLSDHVCQGPVSS